jgi:hypothetical protein
VQRRRSETRCIGVCIVCKSLLRIQSAMGTVFLHPFHGDSVSGVRVGTVSFAPFSGGQRVGHASGQAVSAVPGSSSRACQ